MEDVQLQVISIFPSIDGEANGYRGAGELTMFIRLAGCNLRCKFCDTAHSQAAKGTTMSVLEIINQIPAESKVTITGGEPLLQSVGMIHLCQACRDRGIQVSIETNGSIPIPEPLTCLRGIRFVVDYKLPSSGMMDRMRLEAFNALGSEDVIKFVISNAHEYETAKGVAHALREVQMVPAQIVFSPAVEDQRDYTGWPAKLADKMINDRLWHVQYSLQVHKVLWPYATEEK